MGVIRRIRMGVLGTGTQLETCSEKVEVQAQRSEDLDKEVDGGTTVSIRRNNI